MPKLPSFKMLAPFTADELVEAAQSLLRQKDTHPFSKRTLRYYIFQGVVPPPLGSPKFARYGYEHLLNIMAARMFQDHGLKLDRIVLELSDVHQGRADEVEAMVQKWLANEPVEALNYVRERNPAYSAHLEEAQSLAVGKPVIRIQITPSISMEVDCPPKALRGELVDGLDALKKIVTSLPASA